MLTPSQKGEILRLRGIGTEFKTIARTLGVKPSQVYNFWYHLPEADRLALTKTASPRTRDAESERALRLAKQALQHEIAMAREERHTAPPFKVVPLRW